VVIPGAVLFFRLEYFGGAAGMEENGQEKAVELILDQPKLEVDARNKMG